MVRPYPYFVLRRKDNIHLIHAVVPKLYNRRTSIPYHRVDP